MYFDTVKRSYEDVFIDPEKGISTIQFSEATEGLVLLFDLLESSAFSIVQNDMNGNLKKIQTKYLTDTEANDTLEHLVINEQGQKKREATEGLLWLKRGLEFTAVALRRSIENPDEELSISFTEAYKITLKKFHGMLIRPVFILAMKACPYRADFYKKLGEDQELVQQKLAAWLTALEAVVARLNSFYEAGGHDKGF
ncbi:10891_t:CDS:2 [Ambispora gerdemannii]|uniref:10891_t:CDS:1 n=1 Tax=Ambispora gerdemannii TaxID=144530 RepID=A0A9N8V2L6_9GLOM|nr:10891_t:CDS:2 [Ambispora gerdemannii]